MKKFTALLIGLALTSCNSNDKTVPPGTAGHPERVGTYVCESIDPGIFKGPGCDKVNYLHFQQIDSSGHIQDTVLEAAAEPPVQEKDVGLLVSKENGIFRDDSTEYRFDPSGDTFVTSYIDTGGEERASLVIHFRKISGQEYTTMRKNFEGAEAVRQATLRSFSDAILGQTFRLTSLKISSFDSEGKPTGPPTEVDLETLPRPELYTREIHFIDGTTTAADGAAPNGYRVYTSLRENAVLLVADERRIFGYAQFTADRRTFEVFGAEPVYSSSPGSEWITSTYTLEQ